MSRLANRYILIFLVIFLSTNTIAQIGVKGVLYSPTGDFGFAMKKTFGPEIIWKSTFDKPIRSRIYLNYSQYKPRLDTVRTVSYETSGSGNAVLPGYVVYTKIWNGILGVGLDYSPEFMEDWPVRPYIGLDLNAGAHHRETETDSGVSNFEENITTLFGGVVGRFGAEANIGSISIFADITRNYNLVAEAPSFAYTSIGLGIVYNFEY